MKAVILVGGFGTRLRPLTLERPKQMLPIVGVPMIERVVARLAGNGVHTAVLSLGYKPDAFMDAYPDGRCAGVDLVYAVEPEPLDTAGAIRFAATHAGIDETFLVVNGDVLTDLDAAALAAFHRERGAEATIHLFPVDDPSRFGVVPTDADGRVERFVEKPEPGTAPTNLINAGTYVFEPSVLDRIPADRKVSVERETFPLLVADRTLFAMPAGSVWLDAGTPVTYREAQLTMLDQGAEGILPGAEVLGGSTVRRSVVGAGARVAGTVIDSVLLPGAVVEAGATVERSVLNTGTVVSTGETVTDEIWGAPPLSVGASGEVGAVAAESE